MLRFLCISLVFIAQIQGYCQINGFHFKHLSASDGLSNNSVIAIEQDRLGNIWLGTRNGLNKYNGDRFELFKNEQKNENSLSNSDILSVLEDMEGNIWVGTYSGLNKYDPVKNKFTRYLQTDSKNPIVNDVVICSTELPNGEIWFGTAKGISIYNKSTGIFTNIVFDRQNEEGLPSRNIQRIFLDTNNVLWIATTQGLARLVSRVRDQFVFKQFRKPKSFQEQKAIFIQDVIEVKKNLLGIATKYNGFMYFNTNTYNYITKRHSNLPKNADVRVLELSDEGDIWMGTTNGVVIIDKDKKIHTLENTRDDIASLSRNFIKSIFKDSNGSLWLGTYSGGVNIWNESNENFINIRNHNVDNNFVTAIVFDKYSNLYVGTEGGDISILDKNFNITDVISVKDEQKNHKYAIQSLYVSQENHLWVGLLNRGIVVYDLKTKKKLNTVVTERLQNRLSNTSVFSIKEDPKNIFWIGTFGKGLIRYNNRLKSYRVYGTNVGREPFLTTNYIKSIHIDKHRNIWLGGLGRLNFLRFKKGYNYELTPYVVDYNSGGNIRTIFEDSKENIWVGTNSQGLKRFDGEDFKRVVLDSINPVSTIYSILEHPNGNIWLSCKQGLVEYDPVSEKSKFYYKTGPTNLYEYNANSGIVTEDGQLFFGGEDGVTAVNPQKMVTNYFSPQVVLSDLKIKNKSVEIDDENGVLSKHISYTQKITLDYDNANFSLSYSMPNFHNSDLNSYAYRLIGLDESWSYTNNTEVFYTLQKPGKYIFEVKGANDNGVWNKEITQLYITVNPAPWRSWWAFTIYSILITLGLVGLYLIMQSKTKLQHRVDVQNIEKQRNKEINLAKIQFFTNISHEFRTPLTLILGPLQQILADYSGSNSMYKKLMVIESSANHLLRLINRLMDFRKLENNQASIQTAEGNIVKYLHEIFLSFSEYAKTGNYKYTFDTSDKEILVYYDRYKLERVFYNLISNAFRYTPEGGAINLKIRKKKKEITIELQDSGVGIAEEHIDKIFDRFFEVPIHNKPDKNYNQGTGIGLSIASNIVKLHHGDIMVFNNPNGGATFKVSLLLGKDHLSENEVSSSFKKSDDVTQYVVQLNEDKTEFKEEITDLLPKEKEHTLLLVEDNLSLRSFMRELLKDEYHILQAENGKVGLSIAKKEMPDLIISDVIMPEMVGTDLCSKIKSDIKTSHIPVILLTSRSSLIYKFEGLESGADDYISKPFNLKEFRLRIKNILELKTRLKDKFSGDEKFAPSEVVVTSKDEELLAKAFKIVEDNISNENFDVTSFVSELGVSRSLLFTKIKAWSNMTPNEFIREIRLKRAAQLLEQNKIIVSQVGYKVGFKRPKYFSKCFQKKYGVTPTQYMDKFFNEN